MDRRLVLGSLPYTALAPVLHQVPSPASGFESMPWTHAVAITFLVAGLFTWHCSSYERWWQGHARRIEVNELLARLWVALFGLVVVGGHSDGWPLYAAFDGVWLLATFAVHRSFLRRDGHYHALPNIGVWGLFLLGQALIAVWVLKGGVETLN